MNRQERIEIENEIAKARAKFLALDPVTTDCDIYHQAAEQYYEKKRLLEEMVEE